MLKGTDPLDFKLLDVPYNVQKRDVQESIVRPIAQSSALPLQVQAMNETETDFLERTHRKPPNTMNKVLFSLAVNYTKAMPTNFHGKNLGENGSGIFLNLSTTSPAALPVPIHLPRDTNAIESVTLDSDTDDVEWGRMVDVVTSFNKHVADNNYIVNKTVSIMCISLEIYNMCNVTLGYTSLL